MTMGWESLLLKPAQKYAERQMKQAATFAALAAFAGYKLNSQAAAKGLARASWEWCKEHGMPSLQDVRDELDL